MRSFAPLILAALASSAAAQSFGGSAGQSMPTDMPEFSGRPTGVRTGSAAFPQGTGGFGGHGKHDHASGSGGFARPSGQNEFGAQHSGFPSHTGSDFPFPTGSRPFESGSPLSARNFAREFPSGGNLESLSMPTGTGFGGSQQTGARPTGPLPSGFPSDFPTGFPSGFPTGGPGGAPATGSLGSRPTGFGGVFESGFGGERPTGAFKSGSAFPSADTKFQTNNNYAAHSGLPTIPIPSNGLPLIPTGMPTPSGGFPSTFQTRVRPTTSV
ncbi:hypothetical protein DL95DRAFT_409198 [Leptodontidium sp. 2 PMI_412]|nr:hypothetical protein DL95DRAFT_409198 [Leptodontidium sp. 2 PMI_412]